MPLPGAAGKGPTPLAVTMGEPAGIGGEITVASWRARRSKSLPPFFVIDDPERLKQIGKALSGPVELTVIEEPSEALGLFHRSLPVLPLSQPVEAAAGAPRPENAAMVLESIQRAVALTAGGEAAAVVTNPIHKATLYSAGFLHPGHTEYLAELAGLQSAPIMMLAGPSLRVVPVTIHLALKDAISLLTTEAIVHAGQVTASALKRQFGIDQPRLAVAGLNPHAGEGGSLGKEEQTIISPAVEKLRQAGIDVVGPLPADGMFHAGARKAYDVAVCMYHDQALIPLKALDFDLAVNVTLGLPFIRTSPDHGTAFDIAGTGRASPTSLIAALKLAAKMADEGAQAAPSIAG